jgi:hypothetical protein
MSAGSLCSLCIDPAVWRLSPMSAHPFGSRLFFPFISNIFLPPQAKLLLQRWQRDFQNRRRALLRVLASAFRVRGGGVLARRCVGGLRGAGAVRGVGRVRRGAALPPPRADLLRLHELLLRLRLDFLHDLLSFVCRLDVFILQTKG